MDALFIRNSTRICRQTSAKSPSVCSCIVLSYAPRIVRLCPLKCVSGNCRLWRPESQIRPICRQTSAKSPSVSFGVVLSCIPRIVRLCPLKRVSGNPGLLLYANESYRVANKTNLQAKISEIAVGIADLSVSVKN